MKQGFELCTDLIPANGIHITKTKYPAGFLAAEYDAEGFASRGRWFPDWESASRYASTLGE